MAAEDSLVAAEQANGELLSQLRECQQARAEISRQLDDSQAARSELLDRCAVISRPSIQHDACTGL